MFRYPWNCSSKAWPRRDSSRWGLAPAALLVLLAVLPGCREPETPAERQPPPLVEAVAARRGGLPREETVNGVVRAENQVSIRAEIAARIAQVHVQSGQEVKRGAILVRLQDDELVEQLRRAEADVQFAEASASEAEARTDEVASRVARLRSLAADNLVSPQEMESQVAQLQVSRAGMRAAQARVQQALALADERRSALAKTEVRSPIAGRVGERRIEVGMLVEPGTELFQVGSLERVIVQVTLTEEMLAEVREGQPVQVQPRGDGAETLTGTLARISPFLAAQSFTTVGEIDLENSRQHLRPGMFVTVRILYGDGEEATIIPTSALWEDPRSGERSAFVVEDPAGLVAPAEGRADNPQEARQVAMRKVTVLAQGRGYVGVSGIEEGEWVIITGQHLLRRNLLDTQPEQGTVATTTAARIRPTTWDRITALQDLQREDLLEGFLAKQQIIAAALGPGIPASESVVQQVLDDAASRGEEAKTGEVSPTESGKD